jgi:hypothetical protein
MEKYIYLQFWLKLGRELVSVFLCLPHSSIAVHGKKGTKVRTYAIDLAVHPSWEIRASPGIGCQSFWRGYFCS